MWDMVKVTAGSIDMVNSYLKKGYEPFAATVDKHDTETIWLRKEVPDEVHSKSEPVKGRSRKPTTPE